MKNRLILLSLIVLLSFSSFVYAHGDEKHLLYAIGLKYNNGDVNLLLVDLQEGSVPDYKTDYGYTANLIGFNGSVLYSTKFQIPLVLFSEPPEEIFDDEGNQIVILNESSFTIMNETEFFIALPYFELGKEIQILDEDDVLKLTIDVSEFSDHIEETIKPTIVEDKTTRDLVESVSDNTILVVPIGIGLLVVITLLLKFFYFKK